MGLIDAMNIIQSQLNEATSNESKKKKAELAQYVQETTNRISKAIMSAFDENRDAIDNDVAQYLQRREFNDYGYEMIFIVSVSGNGSGRVHQRGRDQYVQNIVKNAPHSYKETDSGNKNIGISFDHPDLFYIYFNMKKLIADNGIDYEALKKAIPLAVQKLGVRYKMSGVNLDRDKFKEYFEIRNKKNKSDVNKRVRSDIGRDNKERADAKKNRKKEEWESRRKEREEAYYKKQKEYDDEYEAEQARNNQDYKNQSWLKRMFSKPRQAHHKQADRKSYKFD